MEWQIKTIARNSTLSGEAFKSGDKVVCFIFKGKEAGELGRADILPGEVDAFGLPGEVLGRWVRVVQDLDDENTNASETMASAEDFFFSLFENKSLNTKEESDILKYIFSLMLERKRLIRVIGDRESTGEQRYIHVKTKQVFQVPIMDISAELLLKIENIIGDIIL